MPLIAEKGGGSSSGHKAGAEPREVSSSVPPSHLTTSSPSRSSLPGAAVLTEMGSLTLCLPLCVPRALGGVCQGAAGTQQRAGRGGSQRHAELRGGPGPDGGDVVQGRQEAEFELESACGGHGPWAAAGGAAGGQGGCRGVQLRGRGPEGLLPPGRHRSVLGGSQLAYVEVMGQACTPD